MTEFDHKMRVLSEGLARGVNRRGFLQKTGSAIFAGIATLAAGHTLADGAEAAKSGKGIPREPRCSPPGPFCNVDGNNEPNGCHGAHCFQHRFDDVVLQCKVFYAFYDSGCWTTQDGGGYWTCCDCDCGNNIFCGCAQYSYGPIPLPSGQS